MPDQHPNRRLRVDSDMWTKMWNVVDEEYLGPKEQAAACIGADGAAGNCTRTTHGGFWSLGTAGISEFHDRMIRALGPTRSTTDLPVAMFYEELARAFPDAHFILTTRRLEPWAVSAEKQFRQATGNQAIARNRNVGFGTNQFHHHIHRKNFVSFVLFAIGLKSSFLCPRDPHLIISPVDDHSKDPALQGCAARDSLLPAPRDEHRREG
jgi:hypothetical protein